MEKRTKIPLGIKVILGFHLFNTIIWFFGQTLAVFNYDLVASWGLQDPRSLIDPAIVEGNRGIALADTIILLPLFVIAILGLLKRKIYGLITSLLAFGISLYWPVVFWSSQYFFKSEGINHQPTQPEAIILPGIIFIIAAWGSWYLCSNYKMFFKTEE
jgi:hypothetical protein